VTAWQDSLLTKMVYVLKNAEQINSMTLSSNNADVWMVWPVSMEPVQFVLLEPLQLLMVQDVQLVDKINN